MILINGHIFQKNILDFHKISSRSSHRYSKQRFCIYSVLKFAEQMQSTDWFPHLPDVLRFTGETLTEYNGYLNNTSFPTWNRDRYDSFRLRKGKKKWSPDLWSKFQRLCYQLDECFSG